jgi:hypothetical protein
MAEPPMNSPDLMDTFTELLVHLGDKCAKNGYQTNAQDPTGNEEDPTRIPRNTINDAMRLIIVKDIGKFLTDTHDFQFPSMDIYQNQCIIEKVRSLKALYDKSSDDEKAFLISYIEKYEVNPMSGGKRSKKPSRKSKKRKTNKTRSGQKTRSRRF